MGNVSEEARTKIGRKAGAIGICVNIFLFAIKLFAGILSGSVSMVADAVNNLTDAGSSILLLVGYVLSAKPADREHPYGHARMEYLCGLFISIIVTVLGIELFSSSVKSVFSPDNGAEYGVPAVVVMVLAIFIKVALAVFYKIVGKKIDSQNLKAAAVDSIGDVCATSAVILAMILTPVFGPKTDGVFGAVIAVYIFVMGVKLVIESSNTILGKAPDVELVKKIISKIKSYDGVIGIHDLVIHNYGVDKYFASVHVEMDASRDVMESHDIIDNIEVDFKRDMGISLVIHLDPICINDERVIFLKNSIREILDEISGEFSSPISFHDFRAVFGVTHSNLIFDVAITDEFPLKEHELVEMIRDEIKKKLGGEYNSVITIDRDYTTNRY